MDPRNKCRPSRLFSIGSTVCSPICLVCCTLPGPDAWTSPDVLTPGPTIIHISTRYYTVVSLSMYRYQLTRDLLMNNVAYKVIAAWPFQIPSPSGDFKSQNAKPVCLVALRQHASTPKTSHCVLRRICSVCMLYHV